MPFGIDIIRPAEFALNTVALNPRRALRVIEDVAGRSGRTGPKLSVDQVLNHLVSRYGMNGAVELIRLWM